MNKSLCVLTIAALLCIGATCTPPVVPPDAGPPAVFTEAGSEYDVYDRACLNLAANGCVEGTAENCPIMLRKIEQARMIRDFDVSCILLGTSKSALRMCAGIVCE